MSVKRNIYIMYAVSLLHGMVFYAPVASLYRQAAGLNLGQIALIEAVSCLICLLLELPWGMLAERIGYRRTMVVSCGFYFLSKILFWKARSFAAFLMERFLLSIALAGLSGVDQGIIYLSAGDDHAQRAFARCGAFSTAGLLFSSGVFSLCIGSNYRFAALLTLFSYGAALVLVPFLKEVRGRERSSLSPARFLTMLKQTLFRRRFLACLLGLALLREAVQLLSVWLNQNQYLRCGMSDAAMGMAYIFVTLAAMTGAFSHGFTRRMGERRFAGALSALAAAACALPVFTRSALLSVLCVALVSAAGALIFPLGDVIRSRQVRGANHAACLSAFSMIEQCAASAANACCGRIADRSLDAALLLCAGMCMLAGICIVAFLKKQPKAVDKAA